MLVRRIAVCAAVAAGSLVLGVAPASAATPIGQVRCGTSSVTTDGGAKACWDGENNTLWICDTAADGHHPGVWYSLNFGSGTNRQVNVGNGDCSGVGVRAGVVLRFWAANYEGSGQVSKGPTRQLDT